MADKFISELTAASALKSVDTLPIDQDGASSKKVTLNTLGRFSERKGFETPFIDDFVSGATMLWAEVDATNGASSYTEGSPEWWAGAYGIRKLETGTNSAGKVGVRALISIGTGTGKLTTYGRFLIEDMATATNNYIFSLGGVPNGAGAWNNVVASLWFSYSTANWQLTVANGGTVFSTIDTGIAVVSGTWIEAEVWFDMSNDVAGASINGTPTSTITGITHWTPNNRISSNIYIQKTAGTSTMKIAVDEWGYLFQG